MHFFFGFRFFFYFFGSMYVKLLIDKLMIRKLGHAHLLLDGFIFIFKIKIKIE